MTAFEHTTVSPQIKVTAAQPPNRERLARVRDRLVGDASPEEVRRALLRATGRDYSASPHHDDDSVTVHIFRPVLGNVRWYIKAYFIEEADVKAIFISVH